MSMVEKCVKNVITDIKEHAVKIKNNDPVVYKEFPVNAIHWQGDVGIRRLPKLPKDCTKDNKPNLQLAEGNTKGSRHCLESFDGVVVYKKNNPTALEGVILECEKSTEITHPEHGNVTVPCGIYAIVFQRVYAEELKRVKD